MKKTRKIVALVVAIVMIFAVSVVMLAACKPKDDGAYNITVWTSEVEGVSDQFAAQIKKFNETNEWGYKFNAVVEGVGEGDAATQMISDVATGADLFCFAQDQTARLVQAGALAQPGKAAQETIKASHDAGAIKAVTIGEADGEPIIRAYPLTSDNGYFMYYNTSVIKAEHLDSLEDIIADCEAAGMNFSMELDGNAWYVAGFFFGTGCHSEYAYDDEGKPKSIDDDFNSDKGVIAMKGMQKLMKSSVYVSSAKAADFDAATPSAVVVSGTWDVNVAKTALGENFGVTDLPSFTVDGNSYHIGSFSGNKLLGVKPTSDAKKAAALHQLALYLTNAENQLARFNEFGWGPSNLEAQQDEAVKADEALSALAKQNAYATPQGNIDGGWWDIAKVLGPDAQAADLNDDAALKAALEKYDASISASIEKKQNQSDAEAKAWTVIGSINGDEWKIDLEMVESPANTWTTKEAYDITETDQFKVRQGKDWKVNLGLNGELDGGNITLAGLGLSAGKYKIQVVLTVNDSGAVTGGTINLIPAE
ncbi:MAG: extracellular solute-binding protein [Clostridiales bacterium]|nr:extracellular solute-binding protein [Clostridiales bacterium]